MALTEGTLYFNQAIVARTGSWPELVPLPLSEPGFLKTRTTSFARAAGSLLPAIRVIHSNQCAEDRGQLMPLRNWLLVSRQVRQVEFDRFAGVSVASTTDSL